jgi:hypothetical protein
VAQQQAGDLNKLRIAQGIHRLFENPAGLKPAADFFPVKC